MLGMMWLRRPFAHRSRAQAQRRALEELRGREAVRSAEEIVCTIWIDLLKTAAAGGDRAKCDFLEAEWLSHAYTARRRARQARRDQRRGAALMEETDEMTGTPVWHQGPDGEPGTG